MSAIAKTFIDSRHMYFIVTIDTEEDEWSDYRTTGHLLNNLRVIERLQRLFDRYRIRPTYLITYPVATSAYAQDLLGEIVRGNRCEIGAHCHPWNTPPFEESISTYNSMLCNLDARLQYEKLAVLTHTISDNLAVRPVSFRAGRWGYSANVARNLQSLGYRIDTSLTPFINWNQYSGPDFSAAPRVPFRFNPRKIMTADGAGTMVAVPVSIGFNRSNFDRCHWFFRMVEGYRWSKKLFIGGLNRTGILKKIWLSPEMSTTEEMLTLMRMIAFKKEKCLNLMFHSNTLKPGCTPFVRTAAELDRFFNSLETIFQQVTEMKWEPVTLRELASAYFQPDPL